MWRDSLKQSEDDCEMVCDLHAPNILKLKIEPVKKNKEWSEEAVLNIYGDMIHAIKNGEIEISTESCMAYMSERLPGLQGDVYIPILKKNLVDELAEVVRLWKIHYKNNDMELPQPKPKQSKTPVLECTIETYQQDEVTTEQAKAVDYIQENDETICEVLLEALFKDCGEAIEYNGLPEEMNAAPSTKDEVRALCQCHGVDVSEKAHEGMAYAEYSFQVAWLGEDQWLKATMHGDRLVYLGSTGEGWEDPEAI